MEEHDSVRRTTADFPAGSLARVLVDGPTCTGVVRGPHRRGEIVTVVGASLGDVTIQSSQDGPTWLIDPAQLEPVTAGTPTDDLAEVLAMVERLSGPDPDGDPLDVVQRARVEALYAAAVVLGCGPVSGPGTSCRVPLVGASAEVLDVAGWVLTGGREVPAVELEPLSAVVERVPQVPAVPVYVDPVSLRAAGTLVEATIEGRRWRAILGDPGSVIGVRWMASYPEGATWRWARDADLSDVVVVSVPDTTPGSEQ